MFDQPLSSTANNKTDSYNDIVLYCNPSLLILWGNFSKVRIPFFSLFSIDIL